MTVRTPLKFAHGKSYLQTSAEITAPLRIVRLVLYLLVTTCTSVPFHLGDTTRCLCGSLCYAVNNTNLRYGGSHMTETQSGQWPNYSYIVPEIYTRAKVRLI